MPVRPLSPALRHIAEKELNEVSAKIPEDLQHVKDWIAKQPHLKCRTDDQWLLAFLRGCKYSLERTKEKLDCYYSARTLLPEYFTNRDPLLPEVQEFLTKGHLVVLPKPVDKTGCRVFLYRTNGLNHETTPPKVGVRAANMINDILMLEDDHFVVAGAHAIMDFRDIPFSYVTAITPTIQKQVAMLVNKAYPVRTKSVHYVNIPTFAEPLLQLAKLIVPKKIKDRLHFYTKEKFEDLYQFVPRSVLPKEYGGEGGPIDEMIAQMKTKLESYRDWLMDDLQYRSDESKRLGKPISSGDLFGVEGSFRKLEID